MGITIRELKSHLQNMPDELDGFEMVFSEVSILDNETKKWTRKNIPIEAISIDNNSSEMLLTTSTTLDIIDKLTSE